MFLFAGDTSSNVFNSDDLSDKVTQIINNNFINIIAGKNNGIKREEKET